MMAASLGLGLLLKGLIAVVFPVAAACSIFCFTRSLFSRADLEAAEAVVAGIAIMLAIAAPWHVLATLRNPPYFVSRCIAARANITASSGFSSSTSNCCDS